VTLTVGRERGYEENRPVTRRRKQSQFACGGRAAARSGENLVFGRAGGMMGAGVGVVEQRTLSIHWAGLGSDRLTPAAPGICESHFKEAPR